MAKLPGLSAHLKAFGVGATIALAALLGYTYWSSRSAPVEPVPQSPITVYKSPTCGCCTKWVEYLRAEGFTVRVEDRTDVQEIKTDRGVPQQLSSCHTAVVEGYVLEGHVPVADIKRLLKERPKVTGLAVPGMPVGSPGMEQGDRRDPFDVLAFTREGGVGIYSHYRA